MKVFREVAKRLRVAERKLRANKQKEFVMKDLDGLYYDNCGRSLTQEQFGTWAKEQGETVLITVIKYIDGGKLVE